MTHINEIYPPFNTLIDVFCPMCGQSSINDKCSHMVICIEPEFNMLDPELLPQFPGFGVDENRAVVEVEDDELDFPTAVEEFLARTESRDYLALRYHSEGIGCGPMSEVTLYVFDFSRAEDYTGEE